MGDGPENLPEDIKALQAALLATRAELASVRAQQSDDQALIRRGMAMLLDAAPDIQVVGQAADGLEAVQLAQQLRPDVVLMDLHMPRKSGALATREITASLPQTRVMVLTTFDSDELVFAQVLEYAKRTPLGEPVTFTFYEICQDLGWSINGRYYKQAEDCLSRLQASAMQFSSQRLGRLESVSLIRRFRILDRGKRTSRCQVEIGELRIKGGEVGHGCSLGSDSYDCCTIWHQ